MTRRRGLLATILVVVLTLPALLPTSFASAANIGVFGKQKHFELGESLYLWGDGYFPRATCRRKIHFSLADSDHTRFPLGSLRTYQGSKIFLAEAQSGGIGRIPMEATPGPALIRGKQKCGPAQTTGRHFIIITDPTSTPPVISSLSAPDVLSGGLSILRFTLQMEQWGTAYISGDIEYEFLPGRWEKVATVVRNRPYDERGNYRLAWRAKLGPNAPAGHYRFAIDVTRYTFSFGEEISADYEADFFVAERLDVPVVRPVDAQVNHAGMLVAANQGRPDDFSDDSVRVFDETGALVATYRAGFKSPKDVGMGPDDTIYVADSGNFRIQRVQPNGEPGTPFGSAGSGPGQFSPFQGPQGIAVTELNGGRVYVADGDQAEIEVFDLSGAHVTTITGRGTLDDPFSVAVAPDGSIWVADAGTDTVSHFSSTGAFLGELATDFTQPYAVEVDEAMGRIYVSDDVDLDIGTTPGQSVDRPVHVYDLAGTEIASFGGALFGGGAGGLAAAGLAGDVYVVHPDGNRILRYRLP